MPIGTVDTPANEVSGVAEAAEADETVTVVAIPVPKKEKQLALETRQNTLKDNLSKTYQDYLVE